MPSTVSRTNIAPLGIVVMGVSGSGKSTLGALLAARLGCTFIEGDSFHDPASIAMMRAGRPLSDVERGPWLDRVAAALAHEVATRGIAVVACSALKRAYRERITDTLAAPTRFILLDNDPEELRRRLAERSGHYMPPSLLDSQFATLERPGPDERALTLETRVAPAKLVDAAIDWLECPAGAAVLRRSQS